MKFNIGDKVEVQKDYAGGTTLTQGELVVVIGYYYSFQVPIYHVKYDLKDPVSFAILEDEIAYPESLPKGIGGIADTDGCTHDWTVYEGFKEAFTYCKKCDKKCSS